VTGKADDVPEVTTDQLYEQSQERDKEGAISHGDGEVRAEDSPFGPVDPETNINICGGQAGRHWKAKEQQLDYFND